MKLIIGLGNPGEKYKNTRHNAGFMFVDYLLDYRLQTLDFGSKNVTFKFDKYLNSEVVQLPNLSLKSKIEDLVLAKPQTFMNESGEAVKLLMNRYKLSAESDFIVAHDDLDIPLGKFHIQKGRGPKVHNGLESIENHLKTRDFTRIRIGVDSRTPETWIDGETYVLRNFAIEEHIIMNEQVFPTMAIQLESGLNIH